MRYDLINLIDRDIENLETEIGATKSQICQLEKEKEVLKKKLAIANIYRIENDAIAYYRGKAEAEREKVEALENKNRAKDHALSTL